MDVPARSQDSDLEDPLEEPAAVVTCHETRPGKVVITERNNTDGWIATDTPVELEP